MPLGSLAIHGRVARGRLLRGSTLLLARIVSLKRL
jgi:hypothetical protein